jgi:hypothetical protein
MVSPRINLPILLTILTIFSIFTIHPVTSFTIVGRRTIIEKSGAKLRRFSRVEGKDVFGAIGDKLFFVKKESEALKELAVPGSVKLDQNRSGINCWTFKDTEEPWCVYCGVSVPILTF